MTDDILLRMGKVAMAYYQGGEFNPTPSDFTLWLESLPTNLQKGMKAKGFEDCKGILNFKRFYFELRDYGMEEYMKEHLNSEEYEYWKQKEA